MIQVIQMLKQITRFQECYIKLKLYKFFFLMDKIWNINSLPIGDVIILLVKALFFSLSITELVRWMLVLAITIRINFLKFTQSLNWLNGGSSGSSFPDLCPKFIGIFSSYKRLLCRGFHLPKYNRFLKGALKQIGFKI